MNKYIQYSGYTANPSDYDCPDGHLALSLNLINETGNIRPLEHPDVISMPAVNLKESTLACIHTLSDRNNYILSAPAPQEDTTILQWFTFGSTEPASQLLPEPIEGLKSITPMGNMLIVLSAQGINYFLWEGNSYTHIGSRPPFLSLNFSLKLTSPLDSANSQFADDADIDIGRTTRPSDSIEFDNLVFGCLNKYLAEQVHQNGYFSQPFFVRYAYRLYDGSLSWHSAPILMLPSVSPPFCKVEITDADNGLSHCKIRGHASQAQLHCKLLAPDNQISDIFNWKEIIKSIDIFVSAPIYTFDSNSKDHLTIGYLPDIKNFSDFILREPNTDLDFFNGYYTNYLDGTAPNSPQYVSFIKTGQYVIFNKNSNFLDQIRSCDKFYFLSSIKLEDLSAYTLKQTPVPIKDKDLSPDVLVNRERLPDEFQSHYSLVPNSAYVYNNRLHIAAGSLIVPPSLPFNSLSQECAIPEASLTDATITIWAKIDGKSIVTTLSPSALNCDSSIYESPIFTPRFIYVPIPGAYKMEIRNAYRRFTLDLSAHESLNGAYWFSNYAPGLKGDPIWAITEPSDGVDHIDISSKIYVSNVNNPYIFPPEGINTLGISGSASIQRIISATKALSQGQFGQFPLYAFTDQGVWAMEITSSGSYLAKQPITRDICINPDGITQIDSAVLFPSARGIMLISGSQVTCLSDAINSQYPFNLINSIPGSNKLHALLGSEHIINPDEKNSQLDSCLLIDPFRDFLKNCRMIYDYPHQRIIVYNPEYTLSYIYSLSSHLWGMMQSSIKYNVNSYPDAMAISHAGKLINFSADTGLPMPGLLITRPIKLDAPDIYKTISNVIQRGNFSTGHVQSVLYGSRDLINWHPIWSSKDHILSGFRGSPFKYFRIALLCNLDADESITGASIQFYTRLTNRPR